MTKTGMGHKIQGFCAAVKYAAVYGGSEEIMVDLGVRQVYLSLYAG